MRTPVPHGFARCRNPASRTQPKAPGPSSPLPHPQDPPPAPQAWAYVHAAAARTSFPPQPETATAGRQKAWVAGSGCPSGMGAKRTDKTRLRNSARRQYPVASLDRVLLALRYEGRRTRQGGSGAHRASIPYRYPLSPGPNGMSRRSHSPPLDMRSSYQPFPPPSLMSEASSYGPTHALVYDRIPSLRTAAVVALHQQTSPDHKPDTGQYRGLIQVEESCSHTVPALRWTRVAIAGVYN